MALGILVLPTIKSEIPLIAEFVRRFLDCNALCKGNPIPIDFLEGVEIVTTGE